MPIVGILVALAKISTAGATPAPAPSSNFADVDPMIGTGPDGHTFPGATVPFGMVQLSPDTWIGDFHHSYSHAAGYRYEDPTIQGFSHTHFSGAGHSDLGDVLVMPLEGAVQLDPGDPDKPGSGYRSRFSHDTEHAEPGYYAVTLSDSGIRAELTATARVGVHRYRFPEGKPAHLLIDLRQSIYNYPGKVLWSRLTLHPDGTITGARETRGWAPARQLYFAMRFSHTPTGHSFIDREPEPVPYHGFKGPGDDPTDTDAISGRGLVGVVDFGTLAAPLVVEVALSSVSEAGALANLHAEVPGFDFDHVRAAARAAWEQALSSVQFTAPTPMRRTLATSLYHALLAPSLSMDTDGRYRGPDNAVHQARGFDFVSSFSLWDTYRAEQPLMTLIQPYRRTVDVVDSLLASRDESPFGILPIWQIQGQETWCMIGYHAVPEIADAVLKNIPGIDRDRALAAMVASATYAPYGHLGDYMGLGYVPVDHDDEAVSKTMEYAFDDWTIARTARAMGRAAIADTFDKRARNWRNVFDPAIGFVRPKLADGRFRDGFDPTRAGAGSGFTEGDSWQYSWYQPQDVGGLIGLLGDDDRLVAKLDGMFDAPIVPHQYDAVEDMAGLIGQYVHGNEPSHHLAYLYAYAGQAWRGQARLKQIVESQYRPAPDGLVGNDDLGQMSAWMIFTALGFYPVAPGSNEYVIGRPFVDRAVLRLPNGKRFTVIAEGLSDAHPYVGQVTLDGVKLSRSFLRHDEIMRGGTLRFVMQATPNKSWATGRQDRPFSTTPYGE
ncbi:glycoside hydrolase family 92 protein [Lichenicola cladoniae]|uniref:Glycoside hydrolase family 92 protein n=1 Tax=Lichenicola cladoniae TaxID=1484109 RepID=A0A6M8HRH6_9PROT|nr:GH92 family glycosyl hydrolase [Lichenicola cladoniae]NPD65930.1 glycoside hydrolase family 92 protein [Acetobacteraceae bacterium]QKE91079.1 glycoside hydrolase family 92 protein [Lichenicola cladoniae]